MQTKSPKYSNRRRIRNSLRPYLEGECDLKWITGVIGDDVALAKQMLATLPGYGLPARHYELSQWLDSQHTTK